MTGNANPTQFFFELTPERVLEAVEASGLKPTGRCLALNSFENRVYDVELEWEGEEPPPSPSAARRVLKFYRPGRWSEAQILEEHSFLSELVQAEIPAVAPLAFPDGKTLGRTAGGEISYAIFPKVGGRAPDELGTEDLLRVGRLLGRIHNVGSARRAREQRVRLTPEVYGLANLEFLRTWVPLELGERYQAAGRKICELTQPWFESTETLRLHGDCHLGNLLFNSQGAFFVDFDDMVVGPPVQDLWLLIPGRDEEARQKLSLLLEGYEELRAFDRATLRLIEPLRALRFIHYAAWIARRWEDPAFPLAFPHFGSHAYWSEATDDLEEQLRLIQGFESWAKRPGAQEDFT